MPFLAGERGTVITFSNISSNAYSILSNQNIVLYIVFLLDNFGKSVQNSNSQSQSYIYKATDKVNFYYISVNSHDK